MLRTGLDCPICGDVWKRVSFESLHRLGAPQRQCRACLHVFESGEKEWMSLSYSARFGYFAQNALKLVPLALLFIASVIVSIFMNMVPSDDLAEYGKLVALALFAAFLVLNVWSTFKVLLSIRRSKMRRRYATTPWLNTRQQIRANERFISDAAWQREGSKFYARLAPVVEPVEEVSVPVANIPKKMPPVSVRVASVASISSYAVEQLEALA